MLDRSVFSWIGDLYFEEWRFAVSLDFVDIGIVVSRFLCIFPLLDQIFFLCWLLSSSPASFTVSIFLFNIKLSLLLFFHFISSTYFDVEIGFVL